MTEDSGTLFARTYHTHSNQEDKTGTEKKFHLLKKITSVPKKQTSVDRKKNSLC